MNIDEFRKEVLQVKNKLFRIAKRLLNDYEEAEDAVQDIFLKLWENRSNLNKYQNIEAFAVTVTKNYCIDLLRKKKMKLVEMNEEYIEPVMENPEKIFESQESFNIIRYLIDNLPENQRLVIQLRDIEGFSTSEIADIMNISVGNVRVLLSRARNSIRNILTKKYRFYHERN
jgi:RNA polymerase sigma-70 factor (family 1)